MKLNIGNLIAWILFLVAFIGVIIAPLDWQRAGYGLLMAGLGLYLGTVIGGAEHESR